MSLLYGWVLVTKDELHRALNSLVRHICGGIEEPECLQHPLVPVMGPQWLQVGLQ
jgi:hypothetical protein